MKTESNISTNPYYKKYHLLLKKCIEIKIVSVLIKIQHFLSF